MSAPSPSPVNDAESAAGSGNRTWPPGLRYAFGFAALNAASYQIACGNPVILYARWLEAGATVLGLIAGMVPLLNLLQIPAARHVDRIGPKRMVLRGWTVRVALVFLLAAVPLTGSFLERSTRLALLLSVLFAFNLVRGLSVCGWLPWITALVPAKLRGRYLAVEAAWVNGGGLAAFAMVAWLLGVQPSEMRFALVFLFSAGCGTLSLAFLRRMPEATPPEIVVSRSRQPVPWRAIAAHPPFRRILRQSACYQLATGGLLAFTTAFLKTRLGFAEAHVMLLGATTFVGGLSNVWLLGRWLDRIGSKPVLWMAQGMWVGVLGCFAAVAGGWLPPAGGLLAVLLFLAGLGLAAVQMSTLRLLMGTIPAMGRSHFFALFSVVNGLAAGLAPILWGLLIDAARLIETTGWGPLSHRYGLYYLALAMVMIVALFLTRPIEEPESFDLEKLLRELLTRSRLRAWLRFWPRV